MAGETTIPVLSRWSTPGHGRSRGHARRRTSMTAAHRGRPDRCRGHVTEHYYGRDAAERPGRTRKEHATSTIYDKVNRPWATVNPREGHHHALPGGRAGQGDARRRGYATSRLRCGQPAPRYDESGRDGDLRTYSRRPTAPEHDRSGRDDRPVRLQRRQSANGHAMARASAYQRLLPGRDAQGNDQPAGDFVSTSVYDQANQICEQIDAEEHSSYSLYYDDGRLRASVNQVARRTSYTYDAARTAGDGQGSAGSTSTSTTTRTASSRPR